MANDIIGAPEPVLVKGRIFQFSPLNDLEYAALEAWVRFTTDNDNPDGEATDIALSTERGLAQILYASVRRTDGISIVEAAEMLEGDDDACAQVNAAFVKLNSIELECETTGSDNTNDNTNVNPRKSKTNLYLELSNRYGWPPQVIAVMTIYQQLVYAGVAIKNSGVDTRMHFDTEEELAEWRRRRQAQGR